MAAIFISHSSGDNPVAIELATLLTERGFSSLFLDFDSEQGIPGGRSWELELYNRLRSCQAVVVLCSPESMASFWVFAEITHARALGKAVIPIRIKACDLHSILRDVQVIDLVKRPDEGYGRLWRALTEAGLDPSDPLRWQGDRPPYPGLAAFEEADSAVFFGRDEDIRTGLEVLNRIRRFGGAPMVIFLGPSGSGKSSLVRAGILPRLRRNPEWHVLGTVRPHRHPLKALAEAFSSILEQSTTAGIRDRLTGGKATSLLELIDEYRQQSGQPEVRCVLVIDQMEEMLDPDSRGEAEQLIELFTCALKEPEPPLIVIGVMRSDFLDDFQRHPILKTQNFEDLSIRPLDVSEFGRVIAGPARLAGIELEPGLVEHMIEDTASVDALPLLAFALRELWEAYGQSGRITLENYQTGLGGISGSVRRAADGVLNAVAPDAETQAALHAAFRRLVRINDEGQYARRITRWDELPASCHTLLQRFVDARLLVSGKEEERIEVAHEALFRVWPTLKGWLDQDREFLLWRRRLQGAVDEWDRAQTPLRDATLDEAERWYNRRMDDLTATERELIAESVKLRNYFRNRRRHRRLALITGLAGVTVLVSVLLVFSVQQWQAAAESEASTRRQLARTHWISGISARDDRDNAVLASHHFARSAELVPELPQGISALTALQFLNHQNCLRQIIKTGESTAGVRLNHDLTRVLSWQRNDQATLRDQAGQTVGTLPHPGIRGAEFSANGRLVTWGGGGGIRLWQTSDGLLLGQLAADAAARGARFSPDGQTIVSWHADGQVIVWHGQAPVADYRHEGAVIQAMFSHDGGNVISWGRDQTLIIQHLGSDSREQRLPHPSAIYNARISPNGDDLISWDAEGTIRRWSTHSDEQQPVFALTKGGPFNGAAYLGNGNRILTWDKEGNLHIRDRSSGQIRGYFSHRNPLSGVAATPDGERIVTWDSSGLIRVWNGDGLLLHVLTHGDAVNGIRFSRDGLRLLSWSSDRSARLWDLQSGASIGYAMNHAQAVHGARFGPDETTIASWSREGSIRFWSFEPPATTGSRLPLPAQILDVRSSADNQVLRSLTLDGQIYSWTSQGESAVPPLLLKAPGMQDGKLAAGGDRVLGWSDTAIRVWTLPAVPNAMLRRLEIPTSSLQQAQLSQDGSTLIGWNKDGFARIWRTPDGSLVAQLPHGQAVLEATLSPDGRYAITVDANFEIRLWDVTRPQPLLSTAFEQGYARHVAISPNGRLALAVSSSGLVRIWELANGQLLSEVRHGADARAARFSPDSLSYVTWDSSGLIRHWRVADGEETSRSMRHLAGGQETVLRGVVFNRNGERLLSWDTRSNLRVWDIGTGMAVSPRLKHTETINGANNWDVAPSFALAWGRNSISLWRLPDRHPVPDNAALALQQAVLSGTELTDSGELHILDLDEWSRYRSQWRPQGQDWACGY